MIKKNIPFAFVCIIMLFSAVLFSCTTKKINARSTITEQAPEPAAAIDSSPGTKQTQNSKNTTPHNAFAFDCHLHVLQINHVAWSAYISYVEKNPLEQSMSVMSAQDYIFKDFFQTTKSSRNLLAVMERSAGDILQLYEQDLRGKYEVTTTKIEADPITLSIKDALKITQESITGTTVIKPQVKQIGRASCRERV